MRPTSAGEFRHVIRIEEPVTTRGPHNEPVTIWRLFSERHASVKPVTGKESFSAHTIEGDVDTKISIRHKVGVTEKMRVVFKARVYDISAVLEWDHIGREQTLLCKTGINLG